MSCGTKLPRSWIGHTRPRHGPAKAPTRTTGSDERPRRAVPEWELTGTMMVLTGYLTVWMLKIHNVYAAPYGFTA